MLKKFHNERGTAAVLTTLALTALLGFAALVVDVGLWYVNRVQVSNMADATVLAGAQDLPDEVEAGTSADSYALLNGRAGDTVNLNFTDSNTTLMATASRNVINLFSRVFAQFSGTTAVGATATARVFPLGATVGVVPIGVVKEEFNFGNMYTLKVGGGAGTTGNYGALALGGNGASNYLDNIKYGYDSKLRAGDWVSTETGNISGPTTSGIDYRISQDSGATYNTVSQGSPRIAILPVLESLTVNGKGEVHIIGFAAFFLESVGGSGHENEITGRFMRLVVAGDPAADAGANFGVRTVRLIN